MYHIFSFVSRLLHAESSVKLVDWLTIIYRTDKEHGNNGQ